jgi:hypothetical protein
MAYAAAISGPVVADISGRRHLVYTVTETGITGSSDEWSISDVPVCGRVTEIDAVLTKDTGTVTTIDPRIGETTGGAEVFDNGSAGTSIHDTSDHRFTATSRTLYGGARANGTLTGTSTVVTRVTVLAGHQ